MSLLHVKKIFVHVAIIWMTGISLGLFVNFVRPSGRLPWLYPWSTLVESRAFAENIPLIHTEALYNELMAGSVILLDARPLTEYQAGHLPGALSLPVDAFDQHFSEVQLFLFSEQPIVTYCSGPSCDDALRLALRLRDEGFSAVSLYLPGVQDWQATGLPLEAMR